MTYFTYDGPILIGQECCPEVHGCQWKRLLLVLSEEELRFDIANIAFAQGDVARVSDNYGHDLLGDKGEHYLHQWKDICEEGNYERVRRVLEQSMGKIEHMLTRYSAFVTHRDLSLDNVNQENRKEFVLELKVPNTFSDSNCWYLLRLINEYMTCRVLEDWASITLPEVMERWMNKRMEVEEDLKEARSNCGVHHTVQPTII